MLAGQPGLGGPGRVAGTGELVVEKTRFIMLQRAGGHAVIMPRVFHTAQRLPGRL
jgi:plasmid stabilization system protein ParE